MKKNIHSIKHIKLNKIVYLILFFLSNTIYSQRVTYSQSNAEQISLEESNRIKNFNSTKIYDSVDVKAKLKAQFESTSFDFKFKNLDKTSDIILKGTIEKDGTITGVDYLDIQNKILSNNLKHFFSEITNKRIFEAAIINNQIVRSKVNLKLVLNPKRNCIELFML